MRCDSCGQEKVTSEHDGRKLCLTCLSGGKAQAAPGPKSDTSTAPAAPAGAGAPAEGAGLRESGGQPVAGAGDGGLPDMTEVICPSCSTRITTELDRRSTETIPCLQCGASFAVRDAEGPGLGAPTWEASAGVTGGMVPAGRPMGVRVLAWLQAIAGGVTLAVLLASIVYGPLPRAILPDSKGFGVEIVYWPSPQTIGLLAYMVFLGTIACVIATAIGLDGGARWAWYLASFGFMAGIVVELALVVTLSSGRAYYGGLFAVHLFLYVYLLGGRVRAFFGLPGHVGLKTYLAQLGVGVGLALITVRAVHYEEEARLARERERKEAVETLREFVAQRNEALSRERARARKELFEALRQKTDGSFRRLVAERNEALSRERARARERADEALAEAQARLQAERRRRTEILRLLKRGNSHLSKRDTDSAIADFTEAIKLEPRLAVAYYNRGMAYAMNNEFYNARDDFVDAVELDPDGPVGQRARQGLRKLPVR